jgi:hypothetical protein
MDDDRDSEAYRQQLLKEVEAAASEQPARVLPGDVSDYKQQAAQDSGALAERIQRLTLQPDYFDESVRMLLAIAEESKLPVQVRVAAVQRLSAAKFLTNCFEPFHADFIEAMRRLATDASAKVREAALERLTLNGDQVAQKLIRESLAEGAKPLLRTEKAVQMLARDDHSSARPLFRELAEKGTGKIREEALRALGSDPRSAAMLEAVADDKKEAAPVRQSAADGLKAASPPRFAKLVAKQILDPDEDDKVRAAAASAVAHTQDIRDRLSKPKFAEAVTALGESTTSRVLRKSVRHLADRLRRPEG